MKTILHIKTATVLCMLLALPGIAAVTAQPAAERGTITVIGEGTAAAEPDIATIQVGVETFSPDVVTATTGNRTIMMRVHETLVSLGIGERDLQTTNYNVFLEGPYLGPETSGRQETVYHVTNTLLVTVRDLSALGRYIDMAIGAGANQLYGVQFGISDPEKLKALARTNALENARAGAEQLAKTAGLELGKIRTIRESGPVGGAPIPYAVRESAMTTPTAGGELSFSVTLEMEWEIR